MVAFCSAPEIAEVDRSILSGNGRFGCVGQSARKLSAMKLAGDPSVLFA